MSWLRMTNAMNTTRLKMHENAAWLDGQRLPPQGYAADE